MAENKDLEQMSESAKLTTESLIEMKIATQSVEEAYSKFSDVVKKEGLEVATKQFYNLIESMKSFQKQSGDINAAAGITTEKILFLTTATENAAAQLRKGSIQILEQAEQIKKLDEQISKLEGTQQDLVKVEETLAKLRKEAEETNATNIEQLENARVLLGALNKEEEQRVRLLFMRENLDADKKELEAKLKILALSIPLQKYEETRLRATKEMRDGMGDIISKLTGGAEKSNFFASAFLSMQKSIDGTSSGLTGLFKTMGEGLTQSLLNPELALNRVANLINDKLIKSTLDFDRVLAEVGKSAGGFRKEFEAAAMSAGGVSFAELSKYGISIKQYGDAYQSLSKSISGFNNMSVEQKRLLTENAAAMTTLGVSAGQYASLTAKFMNSIGESGKKSSELMNQLAKDAIAAGKSVGDYTSEFERAMGNITGYGRNAIAIFKELNAVSAATMGVVSSQDLLSISDKFKDFESAADSVSKLNAVLGGTSVNILDMMKADPAEQIMMIKRAASDAGLEFDNLNIGYKRLLAESFGGDVLKAQKFFNADLQEAQNIINKQVESEEELNKRKEQNVAFQEKLTALIDNMRVAFMPMLEPMTKFVTMFSKVLSIPGAPMIIFFGTLTGAIMLAVAAITRMRTLAVELTGAIKALGPAGQAAAQQIKGAVQQETAEKERNLAVTKQLKAAEDERRMAGGTPMMGAPGAQGGGLAGGGQTQPQPKGGGIMGGMGRGVGLMAGLMVGGFLLSEASEHLEAKRQKELEQLKSKLRIEEMAARKNLYPASPAPEEYVAEDILLITDNTGKKIKQKIFLDGYGGEEDKSRGAVKSDSGETILGFGTDSGKAKPIMQQLAGDSEATKIMSFAEGGTAKAQAPEQEGFIDKFVSVIRDSFTKTTEISSTREVEKNTILAGGAKQQPTKSSIAEEQKPSVIVNATLMMDNRQFSLLAENVSAKFRDPVG